jgi:hypothetical protein
MGSSRSFLALSVAACASRTAVAEHDGAALPCDRCHNICGDSSGRDHGGWIHDAEHRSRRRNLLTIKSGNDDRLTKSLNLSNVDLAH